MEMNFPDVQFSDMPFGRAQAEISTAVPVFIGYCDTGTANTLYTLADWADYQRQLGGADKRTCKGVKGALYYAVQHYFDNGGAPCFVLCLGTYGSIDNLTAEQLIIALKAEAVTQLIVAESRITLVAMPDLLLLGEGASVAVNWSNGWQALLQICQRRRGLFAVLDAPENVIEAKKCLDASAKWDARQCMSGAAYWPRLATSYVTEDKQRVSVPASASIAAVFQRTDGEQGIWTAPANAVLNAVVKPTQAYQDGLALFNRSGTSLNVIRSFPGRGVRVWGSRTLYNANASASSPWVYIQRRRLVSYIESTLSDIARFVVFEPNNEITWLKLKGQATTWLRELWQQGALYGQQESEAFKLALGLGETMTREDVNAGRLIMRISLALLSPAEFIELDLEFTTRESHSGPGDLALNKGVF
ncbi:phage tail sheath family protein [Pseudomonas chlororaphis]|uniref:Phage tail sheath monomer n=1 Tax=Pseudomonas chlororaphis TaxID=587753 RepID=A0AAX3FTT2_9PSED|nr:phage tail sheath C-terminal domain-containing protein [Pseudomonas chlororaphis]AZC38230.1 Phage tail sheath protein FI [Pseudomonas chlororaphis subsp. piscium]AZC44779.1 Phage tail sheath protein FI [Pseudomonas chlororaphis subsp. piscium]WDG70384.1 phage tail sheath subtilisin-like domain-containing protein [Pseudomonas chlororaphis]WDH31829.1 phage tail sheath subtilisin-like domain-containing protein [Pseudomonas chlororaphis]WDH68910.1 phage tail sheath subtilisin-like domain-contai